MSNEFPNRPAPWAALNTPEARAKRASQDYMIETAEKTAKLDEIRQGHRATYLEQQAAKRAARVAAYKAQRELEQQ